VALQQLSKSLEAFIQIRFDCGVGGLRRHVQSASDGPADLHRSLGSPLGLAKLGEKVGMAHALVVWEVVIDDRVVGGCWRELHLDAMWRGPDRTIGWSEACSQGSEDGGTTVAKGEPRGCR
jgi:hypothetical protein